MSALYGVLGASALFFVGLFTMMNGWALEESYYDYLCWMHAVDGAD